MTTSTSPETASDNCAQKILIKAVRTMHKRRNAPPPIPIPINPIRSDVKVASRKRETLPMVAVELSDYPPTLSRRDIYTIFKGFKIALDFILPIAPRFMYPLRTIIWITGEDEANQAVCKLSGTIVGGRQIRVTRVDQASYEQKEFVVSELVDHLKTAIINTAHVYYPQLATKILEVCEHVEGTCYYAFLQARDPVTLHSKTEAHMQPFTNSVEWELVASGGSNSRVVRGQDESVRLAALKCLQETVEKQGVLKQVWEQWEDSSVLDQSL